MVDQVELHPFLTQTTLAKYLKSENIALEAYGPFAKGKVFEDELLKSLADKYHTGFANIVVRWGLQKDIIMIPKSVTMNRIISNFDVFSFALTESEINEIDNLNLGKRLYTDPDNCPFCPTKEYEI